MPLCPQVRQPALRNVTRQDLILTYPLPALPLCLQTVVAQCRFSLKPDGLLLTALLGGYLCLYLLCPLLADRCCPVPLRSQARRPALGGAIRRRLAAGAAHLLCTGADGGHGRGVARCVALCSGRCCIMELTTLLCSFAHMTTLMCVAKQGGPCTFFFGRCSSKLWPCKVDC